VREVDSFIATVGDEIREILNRMQNILDSVNQVYDNIDMLQGQYIKVRDNLAAGVAVDTIALQRSYEAFASEIKVFERMTRRALGLIGRRLDEIRSEVISFKRLYEHVQLSPGLVDAVEGLIDELDRICKAVKDGLEYISSSVARFGVL
jgi:archaellum component FlaC